MASALEKIMKGTLQKSDSQKAFSPWWEALEDKLLYSVMILGMITLPFNMVSNTPVECTLNQDHPSFENLSIVDQRPMRYHHFYLRKYCTLNFIHDAMIFLPFVLLLSPLPLVGVAKMCLQYFRVVKRMDSFYKLLVKDSLDREDVQAMEEEKLRNSHEVQQMFRDSNGIYHSFVAKSVIQICLGIAVEFLLAWVLFYGLADENIECEVFNQFYVCVVPLATFYTKIVLVANVAFAGYLLCNSYTLVWILVPRLSPFHRFMKITKRYVNVCINYEIEAANEGNKQYTKRFTKCLDSVDSADPFFDVFFDQTSRDLSLLITLLACSNGVSEGIRFVSLFDKEYQTLWKPLDMRIWHDFHEDDVVNVEWEDAPIANFIHNYKGAFGRMRVEYTVEISPPDADEPLKNYVYGLNCKRKKKCPKGDEIYKYAYSFRGVHIPPEEPPGPSSSRPVSAQLPDSYNYKIRPKLVRQPHSIATLSGDYFDEPTSVKREREKKKSNYKIIISTEVNGRTIAQKTLKVPLSPLNKFSPVNPENFERTPTKFDQLEGLLENGECPCCDNEHPDDCPCCGNPAPADNNNEKPLRNGPYVAIQDNQV